MTPVEARKAMNKGAWAQARVYSATTCIGPSIEGFCIVDGPGGAAVVANGEPLLFPTRKAAEKFLAEIRATYTHNPRKPVSPAQREAQRQWKRIALNKW